MSGRTENNGLILFEEEQTERGSGHGGNQRIVSRVDQSKRDCVVIL
jgi:hypothetical protein